MADNQLKVVFGAETQALENELKKTQNTIEGLKARLLAIGEGGKGFDKIKQQIAEAESQAGRLKARLSELKVPDNLSLPPSLKASFLEAASSSASLHTSVQTLGSSVGALINPVALATAGITALGAAGLKATADYATFEQQITRFAAFNDLNAEQTAAFKEQVQQLSSQFSQFSGTQIAGALVEISKAGVSASDAVKLMPTAINFALSAEEDLATSSQKLLGILNGFGAPISQASHFADVLSQSAKDSAIGVNEIALSMTYVAPVASAAGQSIEEMAAMIAILGNAGIKGEKAGTALRGAIAGLVNPTGQTKDALAELGISIQDTEGKMLPLSQIIDEVRQKTASMTEAQKNQYVAQIAGIEGLSAFSVLMQKSPAEIQAVIDKYGGLNGVNAELAGRMNQGLIPAWNGFRNAMGATIVRMGETIAKALQLEAVLRGLAAQLNIFGGQGLGGAIKNANTNTALTLEAQGKVKRNKAGQFELVNQSKNPFVSFITGQSANKAYIDKANKDLAKLQNSKSSKLSDRGILQSISSKDLSGSSTVPKIPGGGGGFRAPGAPVVDDEKKKGKGKKGPSQESLDRKADKTADLQKDLEVAREKTELAEKEASYNAQIRDIKNEISGIEDKLVEDKNKIDDKRSALEDESQLLDAKNKALELEKKKVEQQFAAKKITEQQKAQALTNIELKKNENDYQKDLISVKEKELTLDEKKLANQAEIDKRAQIEKQNRLEEAAALEKVNSANDAIKKQEALIAQTKDADNKTRLQAELEKLKESAVKAREAYDALLNKNKEEIASINRKIANDAQDAKDLQVDIDRKRQSAESDKSASDAQTNADLQTELTQQNQKRAEDLKKALTEGGKSIFNDLSKAWEDGKITFEEVFQIAENIFNKIGDVFKSLNGPGGNGGGFGAIASLFGGKKSGGGSDGGIFDGKNWVDKLGNIIPDPNSSGGGGGFLSKIPFLGKLFGGGAEGGLLGGAAGGPVGAITSIASAAFGIGSTIFGFFKSMKAKKEAKQNAAMQKRLDEALRAYETATKQINKEFEVITDNIEDFSYQVSRKVGKLDLSNSLVNLSKAIDESTSNKSFIESQIPAIMALKQRELAANRAAAATANAIFSGKGKWNSAKENAFRAFLQLEESYGDIIKRYDDQLKQLRRQNEQLADQIDKYTMDLGKMALNFDAEVDLSGYDKAIRAVGQGVAEIINRGSELLEGGFEASKVETLITNQLKDLSEEQLANLDETLNNAIEERKNFLADRIRQLSDTISGIFQKFGFEREETAGAQIQRAIRDFNRDRQKQEADLLQREQKALQNKLDAQSVIEKVIADNLGIINQKAQAGSTEEYLKRLGLSITPSQNGLKNAANILSSALSQGLDDGLSQVAQQVRII